VAVQSLTHRASRRIEARCTPTQLADIRELARVHGLSVSTYVIACAQGRILPGGPGELGELPVRVERLEQQLEQAQRGLLTARPLRCYRVATVLASPHGPDVGDRVGEEPPQPPLLGAEAAPQRCFDALLLLRAARLARFARAAHLLMPVLHARRECSRAPDGRAITNRREPDGP
jgi:hypothetical protein